MYYEEKIENGKMYSRGTPDGEWVECSYEHVVECFVERQKEYRKLLGAVPDDWSNFSLRQDDDNGTSKKLFYYDGG